MWAGSIFVRYVDFYFSNFFIPFIFILFICFYLIKFRVKIVFLFHIHLKHCFFFYAQLLVLRNSPNSNL